MGRGVTVEALEALADIEQLGDDGLVVARFLEARLASDRLRQGYGVRGIVGHQFAQAIDLPVRHLQHAADVAQHGAGLELAEGDDVGDVVGAIALAYIGDHLVAAVLAEVDIEVGHGHAFGVQETLEQEPKADRIEIGDGQRPGDERARPRAAARPDGNPPRLRPFDEIGNDQEIALIVHAGDDVELEGKPLPISLGAVPRRCAFCRQSTREPFLRLPAELRGLHVSLRLRGAAATQELRQDRRMRHRPVGAAARDLDGVVDGLRQIGEQLDHVAGALEVMLRAQPPPLVDPDIAPGGDAEQRVMGFEILGGLEEGLVGGDDRQLRLIGEVEQHRLDRAFLRQAVPLHLDIEAVAKDAFQRREAGAGEVRVGLGKREVDHALGPAGERNEAVGMGGKGTNAGQDLAGLRRGKISVAGETHQIGIAALVLGEHGDAAVSLWPSHLYGRRALFLLDGEAQGERAADDGLDPRAGDGLGEFEGAEQIVGIGDRERRHAVLGGERHEPRNGQRAFEQRIG